MKKYKEHTRHAAATVRPENNGKLRKFSLYTERDVSKFKRGRSDFVQFLCSIDLMIMK